MFTSLSDRLTATFKNLRGKGRLSESDVNATVRDIRLALLDADVSLPVVKKFTSAVRERALGAEVSGALNPAQQVVKIVNEELVGILGGATRTIQFAKNPPTVIMLAGLQGAGKTTLAGKLAHWLKEQGHTPILVAADLQRPNAVTQLEVVGQRAGVPVFAPERGNVGGHDAVGPTGEGTRSFGDPVSVSRAGIEQARRAQHDVVIVDTAGRLAVDANLMQQAADIRAAISPDEVLFVIDAMIGQAAVDTALAFQEGVDFTGVVLSKLDGDARGGAALSVASVTGRPIMFASTGEGVKDFEVFHPDRMASRILDMGDVLTLIEQAEKAFDASQAQEMHRKFLAEEDFTFDDFLQQMSALKKMGGMKAMLGMMPGMGQMKAQLDNLDPREFDRIEAMVRSMTPFERTHSKQINGSRKLRIAKGSGVEVSEVNALLERFTEAQKMMKQLARGGGIPGMPGMPGLGGGKKGRQQQPQRKKSKSGNPAKRAAEERAAAEKASGARAAGGGSAFGGAAGGAGNGGIPADLDPNQLPAGFEKFLGQVSPAAPLHTLSVGTAGPRIAFLHGLFGQGRNWSQIAKALAGPDGTGARSTLVDLPDHGRSPWSQEFSFEGYAAAVADTLRGIDAETPWVVVGHSLGGKTAMLLALQHPELVSRLVVVDIAPKSYGSLERFSGYIEEMQRLPLGDLTNRVDAEARFEEPNAGVKAFLLQNLRRDGESWRWQANLELFAADAAKGTGSVIAAWPEVAAQLAPFPGPVLWVAGSESSYITDEDLPAMRALFPKVRQLTVKGATHWVHTDAPEIVVEALRRFAHTGPS